MLERQGVTADTAGQSENGFTFNNVLVMLFVDIIVFSLLAWYAGHVRKIFAERSIPLERFVYPQPCWLGVAEVCAFDACVVRLGAFAVRTGRYLVHLII